MAATKKPKRGRPRKHVGYIAFNVKITPETWAALKARAVRESQRTEDGHEVSMADVARLALTEWLLLAELKQLPRQKIGGT